MWTTKCRIWARVAVLFFCSGIANAGEVTLRLVDQDGDLIAATLFNTSVGLVGQDQPISIADGSSITVYPGINDQPQTNRLSRTETVSVSEVM